MSILTVSHACQLKADTFQWIQFDATVAEAEDILFTDYFYWEHSSTGSENIAAEEYHIPSHVQAHIDCQYHLVTPAHFRKVKREKTFGN